VFPMNPRTKLRHGIIVCECKYAFSSYLCVCVRKRVNQKSFCTLFASVLFTESQMNFNDSNFSERYYLSEDNAERN
jgi:hypothetical protein